MAESNTLNTAARPFKALFNNDAFAGVLLIAVAVVAVVIANSPFAAPYYRFFHAPLAWTPIARLDTLHLWINDGLMVVFFFVIGLEVKREMIAGNLADARSRRLPVIAAAAGMAVPAAIFFWVTLGEPALTRGWAIPTATDIAFAMGVIGLLARRVPPALRVFLLTIAIVDDIGAVLIIALFYSTNIDLAWLLGSVLILAVMIWLNRSGTARVWPLVLCAVAVWFCVLHSGIHPTIAGVAAALTIPMRPRDGHSILENLEHALVGWNSHFIVPLFGFANAGVALRAVGLDELLAPLPLAVGMGLAIGKQAGIFGSIVVADKIGFARRPDGATWVQIWGTSVLCGVGFTMSLFIGELAFPRYPLLLAEAKIGVLGGSLVSALLGYLILRLAPSPKT